MTISVTCQCGKAYRTGDDKAGKRFKCHECGTLVQVPRTDFDETNDWDEFGFDDLGGPQATDDGARRRLAAARPGTQAANKSAKWNTQKTIFLIIGINVAVVFLILIGTAIGVFFWTKRSDGPSERPSKKAVADAVVADVAAPDAVVPDAAVVKKHMSPAQLELGDPIVDSIGMLLVPIPAGEFRMGSTAQDDQQPQHLVKITKPFYLSAYEVTQQQYETVMGVRPWQGIAGVEYGPDFSANYVKWKDAVEFCRKLSESSNAEYRLPTEAQWEYACRAGTTTAYSFGDDVSKLGDYAWYHANAPDIGEHYAHRVGRKRPNPWGLYDMHGNVREFCQDWYAPYGSETVVSDPTGPELGERRVMRGGSFLFGFSPDRAKSAHRDKELRPEVNHDFIGFRVARDYPGATLEN